MNILLVYPEMPSTFWTMDHLMRMIGKRSSYPPVGLLTVAAMLPREWNTRLVDLNVQPLHDRDLAWADYVFLSAMNVQAASARDVIARCRAVGVKVVAGGTLFTHEYEAFPGVDHFVLNEAELTLPPFLADVAAGCPRPVYRSAEFADVQQAPVPRWELADRERYAYAIVQYSRGCPYQCDFCDVTALFGRRPRTKTPQQILAELDAIGDLGTFDMVLFADDNLIGNKKALKTELLPALIEWRRRVRPPIGFATQVTVNLADDSELMQLMLEAGFRNIFIGIETPDAASLVACKKQQNTRRDLLENIRRLHAAGFIVTGGFIVGFDTDQPDIFQRQVDFIQQSGIVIATMNLLKAPPGTELHERMQREGRLVEPFDFDENRTNILPRMGADALYAGYDHVLRHVYDPAHVYQRALTFLDTGREPAVATRFTGPLRRRDVATFFRIVYHLGLRSPERAYLWRLLWHTLTRHRDRLRMAFLFTVLIHQFRQMYERFQASAPGRSGPARAAAPQRHGGSASHGRSIGPERQLHDQLVAVVPGDVTDLERRHDRRRVRDAEVGPAETRSHDHEVRPPRADAPPGAVR
jgi:radical SAM superfamily enzyme YgiQ (UPF0313 family)